MKRRKAREYALQMLFQWDFTQRAYDERAVEDFWADKKVHDDVRDFASNLVRGTVDNLETIDTVIEKVTENWILQRMAAVDRNILRFAAYEILYRKDIPAAVTINEAIEIAKKYSTTEAASFLNGVLDRIAKEAHKV